MNWPIEVRRWHYSNKKKREGGGGEEDKEEDDDDNDASKFHFTSFGCAMKGASNNYTGASAPPSFSIIK